MHTLTFAHSRYHLPLMPLVMLFAAGAIAHAGSIWRQRRRPAFLAATGVCGLLVTGWAWLFVAVDWDWTYRRPAVVNQESGVRSQESEKATDP